MAQPGLELERDPWCALISAFLELFIACVLLVSTGISLFTSKLIKFFDLPHPCSYLGLQHQGSLLCEQHKRLELLNHRSHDTCIECLRAATVLPIASSSCDNCSPSRTVRKLKEIEQEQDDGTTLWFDKRNTVTALVRGGSTGDRCVKRKLAKILQEDVNEEIIVEDKPEVTGDNNSFPDGQPEIKEAEDKVPELKMGQAARASSTSSEVSVESVKAAFQMERDKLNALYSELEEERNASAIAANEAMAMITRLQEEKAAIQMESRQYQRMVEEKADYDQEAITLLKEILLRREHEKFVLEKEVELYRERLLSDRTEDWRGGDEENKENEPVTFSIEKSNDVLLLEASPDQKMGRRYSFQHGNTMKGCNLLETFDMVGTGNESPNSGNCSASFSDGSFEDNEQDSFGFQRGSHSDGCPDTRKVQAEDPIYSESRSSTLEQNGVEEQGPSSGDGGGTAAALEFDPGFADMRTTSMVMRDNFRVAMEEDIRELTTRLQVLEDDRQLLKQIVQSLKAEKQELREIAQHLRELRVGSDAKQQQQQHQQPDEEKASAFHHQVTMAKKRRMDALIQAV